MPLTDTDAVPAPLRRLKKNYFGGRGDDIIRDFLSPLLRQAEAYDRITGDFASGFLKAGAEAFSDFFIREGRMRLISNGRFTEADAAAVERGLSLQSVMHARLMEELDKELGSATAFEQNHLRVFTWLLQTRRLELKVAVMNDAHGRPQPSGMYGDFHYKIGVFHLAGGQRAAFIGSINESLRAYTKNGESITCTYSWDDSDKGNLRDWADYFEDAWRDGLIGSTVLDFTDAVRANLVARYSLDSPPTSPQEKHREANTEDKWRHQKEAIAAFLENENGILEMATGTGKTRTAMEIMKKLWNQGVEGCVITTSGTDLLNQWYNELISFFGPQSVEISRKFGPHNEMAFFTHSKSPGRILLISLDQLREHGEIHAKKWTKNQLLIIDEVHNLGSSLRVRDLGFLQSQFRHRLGLSATPDRAYDQEGNEFIQQTVGSVIFRFTLEDAIKRGILCEFDYVPLTYEFTEQDQDRYRAVYARKAAAEAHGIPWTDEKLWTELARVRKTARGKLPPFREFLKDNSHLLKNCIIFVEDREYGEKVQEIIFDFNSDFHTYYGQDEEEILDKFSRSGFDCLVTCKKIGEGVDIRSVSCIILFSSDRGRLTTTQRIGRALRSDPDNPAKRATIIDFVERRDIQPPDDGPPSADKQRLEWLSELATVRREMT